MRHAGWTALGLQLALPCSALSPALPPPCPVAFYHQQLLPQLIALVGAETAVSSSDIGRKAQCAAEELGRRGEEVVPPLIALMQRRRDPVTDLLAMEALCGKGHSGSSAIGYLIKRLSTDRSGFTIEAHDAISCMGPHAKAAIPYLLLTSSGDSRAVANLGLLAKYYPSTIVPRLTELLDNPARTIDAAAALRNAGVSARPAQHALSRHLALAVTEHNDTAASELARAIGRVGEPSVSVPILLPLLDSPGTREAAVDALDRIGPPAAAAVAPLIRRLNDPKIDELERYADVSALASIDTGSPQVLSVLLHEVVSDKGGAAKLAAVALAKPERLPPDLAPQLASAIRSLPEGDDKRALLAQALEHAR